MTPRSASPPRRSPASSSTRPGGSSQSPTRAEQLVEHLRLQPNDIELYRTALTHRSAAGLIGDRSGDSPAPVSNERLEFLGDAILGALVADDLYHRFPEAPEGSLTRRRSAIVRTEQLTRWAREIELDRFLYLAPGERVSESGRDRILAGAFEALIGAITVDRGFPAARRWLGRFLKRDVTKILASLPQANPKGRLQEASQEVERITPVYQTIQTEGPAHQRTFTVQVHVGGEALATGVGASKRAAEEAAATAALDRLAKEGYGLLRASRHGTAERNVGE
jgi:ribonuclease III